MTEHSPAWLPAYAATINTLIDDSGAESVLVLTELPPEAVTSALKAVTTTVMNYDQWMQYSRNATPQPFDLGVMVEALEHYPDNQASPLLAGLRDLYCKQLLVICRLAGETESSGWRGNDFLGFGMAAIARYQEKPVPIRAYHFDIVTYKPAPDWLNPRYWANPEMWDKYRW